MAPSRSAREGSAGRPSSTHWEALVGAILGEAIAEFSGSMERANSLGGDAAEAIALLIRSLAETGASSRVAAILVEGLRPQKP
ncbi:hypothetical protein [Streptacidiphilus sp. P02-A3a]|uniref:hypothetical protein n=1 Tax=Streptacidiphilus sp. P02-A3a TaxID=2704468 RepID=UPI0015FCC883|nr:hypothetical protein [Streptacidiphilus sp. P02-A3a]QMU69168.1 hypothetical protein GXP74_13820 [Streptacidiphilus sp. P02-A3a]